MGYIRHNAIVVTGARNAMDQLEMVHHTAQEEVVKKNLSKTERY